MTRDFQLPGRSVVMACDGMVATSHPLASAAAIETLRAGGTAADAAVSAVALLCVIEPHMTGIGGDCFCMISKPDAPVWAYNGSGRSARAASIEALLAKGMHSIDPQSIHAVTVPGAVDAWGAILAAHGRFDLERALAPAIRYAEGGFPVAPRIAWDWSRALAKLKGDPGATRHYLVDGKPPREGDVMRLPALARTLEAIAAKGPRAFYEGDIAQDMVATLAPRGSFLKMEDFATHRGEVVNPISTNYRGHEILEMPPNTHGFTVLVLLNMLEHFDLAALDPLGPERFHIMLESARLAYAVRDTHLADPKAMRVSVPALIDKKFAADLAHRVDISRRTPLPSAPAPGSDTVYLTVVDRDRMVVSLINTLFNTFGVGICTEQTGIMLTNRGACFVLDPDHPNAFGPAKLPLHTIIPALAFRNQQCEMTFGVMGAHYQPMGQVQLLTNVIDCGMDVQAAIDSPRAFFVGEQTIVEHGLPLPTREGLAARGHRIALADAPWGGAQAIRIDWKRGILIGGSDPRKDGCALGY
jgi:gamma-glutamyltranspeptidase/glutathione hydrolase